MLFRRMILILVCSLLFISCSQADTVFRDTHGKSVHTSELRGKWLIVNIWASWCDSCIKEIPELNRFYRNNKDVAMYGVDYDRNTPAELKRAVHAIGMEFPVLMEDPSEAWHLSDVDAVPTTFIINPDGQIVKTIIGPNSEQSLTETLRSLQ